LPGQVIKTEQMTDYITRTEEDIIEGAEGIFGFDG